MIYATIELTCADLFLLYKADRVRHIRFLETLVSFCMIAAPCRAESLKELLVANHVPLALLGEAELAQTVQGYGQSNEKQVIVAYQKLDRNSFVGPPRLVKYDKTSGAVIRSKRYMDENDVCSGSVGDIYFIGEFTLFSTHLSPSAACLLVLGKDLALRQTLYGFGPIEVAPHLIVITENLRHFAPVHPERLQLANLRTGITSEVYPPKNDALRGQLTSEHAKHMPPEQICARMNDPCDSRQFDEDIRSLASDGHGRFGFLALQSASHSEVEGQSPKTVVAQTVLYLYASTQDGWRYCERKVDDSEIEALDKELKFHLSNIAASCAPNLSVVPDMSTADDNPFLKH